MSQSKNFGSLRFVGRDWSVFGRRKIAPELNSDSLKLLTKIIQIEMKSIYGKFTSRNNIIPVKSTVMVPKVLHQIGSFLARTPTKTSSNTFLFGEFWTSSQKFDFFRGSDRNFSPNVNTDVHRINFQLASTVKCPMTTTFSNDIESLRIVKSFQLFKLRYFFFQCFGSQLKHTC